MKKIFTFALAAMVASVSFGQTFKSVQKYEKTAANQKVAITASSTAQDRNKVAPKAAPIEFVATSASAQYYASDGDWYVVLSNGATAFRFDVVTNSSAPLEFDHTYTLDDMDSGYSWYGPNANNGVDYAAATLTPKQGTDGTDYEANVTLTNGQSYHITYTAGIKEYEIVATSASAKYYDEDGDWYVVLEDASNAFRFDIITNDPTPLQLGHTYTLADMDAGYSWYGPGSSSAVSYSAAELTPKQGAAGVDYEANVTLTNGNVYHITYTTAPLPEPTETVEVEFTPDETDLVDASASQGLVQFSGLKEDTGFEAFVTFITDQVAGEYTMEDVYPSPYTGLYLNTDDLVGVDALDITATVTEYNNGSYKAVVDYLGANTVLYKLTFNHGDVPTAINDITTEAGIKTIKKIENGQVVIVMGDKKFNTIGQAVK